jgi:uncharacterized protein YyaL (SSP411 family)
MYMQLIKYLTLTMLMTAAWSCTAQNKPAEPAVINWVSFEEAVALAEKEPKNIFIDFYTSWCGWCKVMDKNTFANPVIAELMNKYFYAVKFNAEGKDPVEFRGKTYNFVAQGNRGYHELAAGIMQGQMSYPTFVFLTPNMEIITPVSGFVKPEEFEPIVTYMGQNLYQPDKGVEWESYRNNFQGKVGK